MTDISSALTKIMHDNHCSSAYAFYLLGGAYDTVSVHEPVCAEADQQYQLGARNRGRKGVYSHAEGKRSPYGQRS